MNIIIKLLSLLSVIFLLGNSGCASFATGALEAYNEKAEDDRRQNRAISSVVGGEENFVLLDQMSNCTTRINNNPSYNILMIKSPDPDKLTFKHFSDETYISYVEKNALRNYLLDLETCYTPNSFNSANPAVTQLYAIADEAWNNFMIISAQLYNADITWGEYNTQNAKLTNSAKSKISTWQSSISSRIQSNYDKEILVDEMREARYERQRLINDLNSARNEIRNLNRKVRYRNLNIY